MVNTIKKSNRKLKNKKEGKENRRIACSWTKFISSQEVQILVLVLDAVSCSDTCQPCWRHTVHSSSNCRHFRGTLFLYFLSLFWHNSPHWARATSFTRFLDHTQRLTTFGRTHFDEGSARRRDLYLTTHKTYNRQTFMPSVRFEPTVLAGERPQTHALDRAATGNGFSVFTVLANFEPTYVRQSSQSQH